MSENEPKNLSTLIVEALRIKGISVEKLAQITGISERPIIMLIEEKWEKLPPAPYVHGYLMKIAEVLGLDGKKLWQEFVKDNQAIRRSGKEDHLPRNRFALPRWNRKFIWLGLIVLAIIIYGAVRIIGFSNRPYLAVTNLPDNTSVTSSIFKITGQMDPQAQLTLNNEQVYPDKNGNFEKDVSLQSGFNTLVFVIKKPLGKEYAVTKQIFYETGTSTKPIPANQ